MESVVIFFSKEVLKYTFSKVKSKFNKEHIEPFMIKSKRISTFHYSDTKINNNRLRLSIDYENDYDYVAGITNYLFKKKELTFQQKTYLL